MKPSCAVMKFTQDHGRRPWWLNISADAHSRGAIVLPRTAATSARRVVGLWHLDMRDSDGQTSTVRAKALVNSAGPWVDDVVGRVAGRNSQYKVRLVKGSHIVLPKFWEGPHAYLLQNDDKRVIFVNPYERDLCLVGTTDVPYEGKPEEVAIESKEIEYLLRVVNRYSVRQLNKTDIRWSFSGVRPLYDNDSEASASAVTRDYVFEVDDAGGQPPLLSVFGGKITTFRKLAEHALDHLASVFPSAGKAWTATAHLPGGDIEHADFARFLAGLQAEFAWLPPRLAEHYARLYGTRAAELIGGAGALADLGRHFGGLLYQREAEFLRRTEWARTAEDVLQRRTKHILHLSPAERGAFEHWMDAA